MYRQRHAVHVRIISMNTQRRLYKKEPDCVVIISLGYQYKSTTLIKYKILNEIILAVHWD